MTNGRFLLFNKCLIIKKSIKVPTKTMMKNCKSPQIKKTELKSITTKFLSFRDLQAKYTNRNSGKNPKMKIGDENNISKAS